MSLAILVDVYSLTMEGIFLKPPPPLISSRFLSTRGVGRSNWKSGGSKICDPPLPTLYKGGSKTDDQLPFCSGQPPPPPPLLIDQSLNRNSKFPNYHYRYISKHFKVLQTIGGRKFEKQATTIQVSEAISDMLIGIGLSKKCQFLSLSIYRST